MSGNVAVLEGFTEGYVATCTECTLLILVKPGTALDSRFKAWDIDSQEYVIINGWLWSFNDAVH